MVMSDVAPGTLELVRLFVNTVDLGDGADELACPADSCGWAFYDHARNRSRRWCSMAVCGNRTKARSYRRRHAA